MGIETKGDLNAQDMCFRCSEDLINAFKKQKPSVSRISNKMSLFFKTKGLIMQNPKPEDLEKTIQEDKQVGIGDDTECLKEIGKKGERD